MHAQTEDRTSVPTTIYARIGAQRAMECGGSPPLSGVGTKFSRHSGGKEQSGSKLPHSIPPRFVVTLDAPLSARGSVTRIPIAITGKWVRDGSEFAITLGDLEEIARNFSRRRNGEINVDYDHASEMPEVAVGGPVPSAGRIVRLDAPEELGQSSVVSRQSSVARTVAALKSATDDGPRTTDHGRPSIENRQSAIANSPDSRFILYGWYEPTERARQLIENREYRYISPAINWAARDKRTGKKSGTTLTSVALTNRPFLEELPQIRLSDPAFQLVDVGDVHVDTSLGQPEEPKSEVRSQKSEGEGQGANPKSEIANSHGGLMKQVKLSVEDGKVKVAHDDFSDEYCADPVEMKKCLDDLGESLDDSGDADASLAELEALAGLAGGAGGLAGAGAGNRSATLSECVAEIRRRLETRHEISVREASALLSENEAGGKSISAADYFRSRVEQELDEAVRNGKVLPRQREDWRKIALSDFPTFRKIVAEQKTQVPLRPVGLSGSGPEDPQTQVKLLAEQRMRERSISFGQALSEIGREHPDLVHQYRRAVSGGEA